MQNFAYFQHVDSGYSCHCERDASCHMTCLSVCLSAGSHRPVSEITRPKFTEFLHMFAVAVASSDGVAICYALPVLQIVTQTCHALKSRPIW